MSQYIHIGKIVAPHGITGHVIIEHALGKPIHFKGIDALFVEKNAASFIPYFIQSPSELKIPRTTTRTTNRLFICRCFVRLPFGQ